MEPLAPRLNAIIDPVLEENPVKSRFTPILGRENHQ
jgi:hypothetical protein